MSGDASEPTLGTTLPPEVMERLRVHCHQLKLKMREFITGLMEFYEHCGHHHPEFDIRGYRDIRRR